jgi:hypothetical protein
MFLLTIEKEAPNPTKFMKFNECLAAFTAAIFTRIVLDDSCTWWSSKPLQRWTCLHHWDSGISQYPVSSLALCGLAQEDFIDHNNL